MSTSDTPRTDAELAEYNGLVKTRHWLPPEFARTLERELTAARAEATRLREALEWLETEAPHISHDSWSCSVDMAGNRWTIQFRNDGKRERFRGRTLVETIEKARAAQPAPTPL